MKRSGQIALVVMGVATATAAAGYLSRGTDCEPQAQQAKDGEKPACAASNSSTSSRSYRSRTAFPRWGSSSDSSADGSTRTQLAPGSGGATRTSTSTSRGGFGSFGFSFSRGS